MMYQANAPLFGPDDRLAKLLMAQQPDYSSMKQSPLQGLAAALGQIGGAYMAKKNDTAERKEAMKTYQDAMGVNSGTTPVFDPNTKQWSQGSPGNYDLMGKILMQSEKTAPLAERMMGGQLDAQMGLQNKIAEMKALMPYEIQLARAKAQAGATAPSNVQEWMYYNQLSPEQREQYLTMKRANQVINLGGSQVIPSQVNPAGAPQANFAVTPKPDEMPAFQAEQEEAKVLGKDRGERKAQLPETLAGGQQTVQLLDEIVKHPGLEMAVGGSSVIPKIPGTDQADFIARLDQIQGKQFLEAYQKLRGGGQITQVEGQKAEQAIARMQRSQSEQEFVKAANEFKAIVQQGVERARLATGDNSPAPKPSSGPLSPEEQAELEALRKRFGQRK